MQSIEIVRAWLKAFEEGDLERLDALTSHDFVHDHPRGPGPLRKWEYLDLVGALRAGFPDWRFNVGHLEHKVGRVQGFLKVTGTHDAVLDLTSLGVSPLEPTGTTIALPEEPVFWTVRGSKVSRMEVQAVDGGGLDGILGALGAEAPKRPATAASHLA